MKLLTFLLIMWFSANLLAQEFDVRSFEVDLTDMAARLHSRTTVNDEPAALIKVVTNISGMIFDSNLGIVDVEHHEAEYWVYVPPRERRIRLMAPGYLAEDVSLPEPARGSTVYQLVVTSVSAETTDLIPVNIIIEGHDDAILLINEEPFPVNQTISLHRGENNIHIEKKGYRTINTTIEVNETNTLFRYVLEGINEEVVTIRSIPQGANVFINRVGQDEVTDFQTFLFPGEYNLRLSLSEYADFEATITVVENQQNEFSFELERYAGTLVLNIEPSDATVLINQRDYSDRQQIVLAPGMYRLVVEKEGYSSFEERFQIVEGDETNISVSLVQKTGSLRLISSSPDAQFSLFNQHDTIIEQWTGTKQLRDLPIGGYRYEGRLDGYENLSGQILIMENEQALVNAVFEEEDRSQHTRRHEPTPTPTREQQPAEIQDKQTETSALDIFAQDSHSFFHISFAQMSLETTSFNKNIDSSIGIDVGFNKFAQFWGYSIGAGLNVLSMSDIANQSFDYDFITVGNLYAVIGPKLSLSFINVFFMAGWEGAALNYGNDDSLVEGTILAGDFIMSYGIVIKPQNWNIGFRYAGSTALEVMDHYPPLSKQEFGLIIKI